jgi:hypothetical protein
MRPLQRGLPPASHRPSSYSLEQLSRDQHHRRLAIKSGSLRDRGRNVDKVYRRHCTANRPTSHLSYYGDVNGTFVSLTRAANRRFQRECNVIGSLEEFLEVILPSHEDPALPLRPWKKRSTGHPLAYRLNRRQSWVAEAPTRPADDSQQMRELRVQHLIRPIGMLASTVYSYHVMHHVLYGQARCSVLFVW